MAGSTRHIIAEWQGLHRRSNFRFHPGTGSDLSMTLYMPQAHACLRGRLLPTIAVSVQAVETFGAKQTYGQLLSHMTATLHKATKGSNANAAAAYSGGGGGLLGALLGDILMAGPSEPQVPVLSCDKPIDLNTRLMM